MLQVVGWKSNRTNFFSVSQLVCDLQGLKLELETTTSLNTAVYCSKIVKNMIKVDLGRVLDTLRCTKTQTVHWTNY